MFNKFAEEYSDMVDWNDDMEASFERDLNRPFIHGPNMSEELGVVGIPHVLHRCERQHRVRPQRHPDQPRRDEPSLEPDPRRLIHPKGSIQVPAVHRPHADSPLTREHLHAMWSIRTGLAGHGQGV